MRKPLDTVLGVGLCVSPYYFVTEQQQQASRVLGVRMSLCDANDSFANLFPSIPKNKLLPIFLRNDF